MDLQAESNAYWDAKDDRVDQRRLEFLASFVPKDARVLIVDGGPGMLAEVLRARGHALQMTDVSSVAVARARAKGFAACVADTDSDTLPFADGEFDCVISDSAIEHRFHWERALKEAVRVLRVDGTLLLLVPNTAHWRHRWNLFWGDWQPVEGSATDRCHLRFFSRRELERAVEALECTTVQRSGWAAVWVKGLWPACCRMPLIRSVCEALARWWPTLFARDVILSARKVRRSSN
jgi:SAM-dependent methyltransferase